MPNLRREAKGRPCMVRIPNVCNGDPETTVLAHLNGGGMGRKHHDLIASWCCSSCHDVVDGRARTSYDKATLDEWLKDGILRTIEALAEEGKIWTS